MEVIGRGFGIVVCHQGLQFFPNRAAALHEMHRVLIPGGRFAFTFQRVRTVSGTLRCSRRELMPSAP